MKIFTRCMAFLMTALICGTTWAQSTTPLQVTVNTNKPFSYVDEQGDLKGLESDFIKQAFVRAGIDIANAKFIPAENPDTVVKTSYENDTFGVGGISTTADRNRLVDFTHSYTSSYIEAATHVDDNKIHTKGMWEVIFSWFTLLRLFLPLFIAPVIAGLIWWLVEFRHQVNQKLTDCIYDSTGMMITYGASRKLLTKHLNLIGLPLVIFMSLVNNYYTGYVVTDMGRQIISKSVTSESDLNGKRIVVKTGTMADHYITNLGHNPLRVSSNEEAVKAVVEKRASVIVADRAFLIYTAQSQPLTIADLRISSGGVAIVVPKKSKHLRALNQAVLELKETPAHKEHFQKLLNGK